MKVVWPLYIFGKQDPVGLPNHHANFGFLSYHPLFILYINLVQCTCLLFSLIFFPLLPLCPSVKAWPSTITQSPPCTIIPLCVSFFHDCPFILVHYKNPGPREIRRPLGPFVSVTMSSTWIAHTSPNSCTLLCNTICDQDIASHIISHTVTLSPIEFKRGKYGSTSQGPFTSNKCH